VSKKEEDLREEVLNANLELVASGLVMGTFGNVSGLDREAGVFFIKPSGVPYEELTPASMVPVDVHSGEVVDGTLKPSSDTPTHRVLYQAFDCGGIAHTHSPYATVLAQARMSLRCMGTTHADFFRGEVPITRDLKEAEIDEEYERNTGTVIVEAFRTGNISPQEIQACLVSRHGPFTWGRNAAEAVKHSTILEYLAHMEVVQRTLDPSAPPPPQALIEKHFTRKHGEGAYYGQG
jgi:L-ribulose-5-phosphate 4-epimerase